MPSYCQNSPENNGETRAAGFVEVDLVHLQGSGSCPPSSVASPQEQMQAADGVRGHALLQTGLAVFSVAESDMRNSAVILSFSLFISFFYNYHVLDWWLMGNRQMQY